MPESRQYMYGCNTSGVPGVVVCRIGSILGDRVESLKDAIEREHKDARVIVFSLADADYLGPSVVKYIEDLSASHRAAVVLCAASREVLAQFRAPTIQVYTTQADALEALRAQLLSSGAAIVEESWSAGSCVNLGVANCELAANHNIIGAKLDERILHDEAAFSASIDLTGIKQVPIWLESALRRSADAIQSRGGKFILVGPALGTSSPRPWPRCMAAAPGNDAARELAEQHYKATIGCYFKEHGKTHCIERVEPTAIPGCVCVKLFGHLDVGERLNEFDRTVEELKKQGNTDFIFDMRDLLSLNNLGDGVMVAFADNMEKSGGSAVLFAIHPRVGVVLQMLGLTSFFRIVPNRRKAEELVLTLRGR